MSSAPEPSSSQDTSDWIKLPLAQKLSWTQTYGEVFVTLRLPRAVSKREGVRVELLPARLALELPSLGAFLDQPLHGRIKPSESFWTLSGPELQLCLTKDGGPAIWKALFDRPDENALEKPHTAVLRELVESTDEAPGGPLDQMDEESRDLVETLRERQMMVSAGQLSLEESFDDFRMPIGKGMY